MNKLEDVVTGSRSTTQNSSSGSRLRHAAWTVYSRYAVCAGVRSPGNCRYAAHGADARPRSTDCSADGGARNAPARIRHVSRHASRHARPAVPQPGVQPLQQQVPALSIASRDSAKTFAENKHFTKQQTLVRLLSMYECTTFGAVPARGRAYLGWVRVELAVVVVPLRPDALDLVHGFASVLHVRLAQHVVDDV